jgi:hypothetical protein
MTLNPKKCTVTIIDFSKYKAKSKDWKFYVKGVEVVTVENLTVLGVIFNSKCNWEDNVVSMIGKASKRLFMLKKLHSTGYGCGELVKTYVTYIRPLLENCVNVWGPGLNNKLCNKMVRFEKRCLSIISRKWVDRNNYESVLKGLKLEGIVVRREGAFVKFGRKLLFSKRYRGFLPKLEVGASARVLRSRKNILYQGIIKNNRYSLSTIPLLIRLVNDEYVESGKVLGVELQTVIDLNL